MWNKLNRPIVILVFALAVRGGVCYWNFDQFASDPDAYARIATTLSETGVYGLADSEGDPKPTAFRPPLYPFLLSWLVSDGQVSPFAVACLHTVLGAITVLCAFSMSNTLIGPSAGERVSLLAAGLVALDPILIQQSTLVMTETLATALASLVMWWWVHSDGFHVDSVRVKIRAAVILGILLALAYLCRPTFLVWAVLLSGAVIFVRAETWGVPVAWSSMVLLCVAIAMYLWTDRNRRELGHKVWATTHGGYTLLLANNPSFYDYLRHGDWGEAWDAEYFLQAYEHRYDGDANTAEFWQTDWSSAPIRPSDPTITEYEDDRVCYLAARATIDRNPGTFVWSCIVRVVRLWSPLPHHTPGRSWLKVAVIGLYYSLFYVAVFVGMWRLGRQVFTSRWWHLWTLAIALSVVHAVYWSNLRMRAPIIPALAIVAAASIAPRPTPTRSAGEVTIVQFR